LSSNNLFNLSETTFNGLENLDMIRIMENDLQSLPRNIFKDLYVSELGLYGNDLVCLPILPPSVSTLNLTATEDKEDRQSYSFATGENGYYKNKLNTHGLQLCQLPMLFLDRPRICRLGRLWNTSTGRVVSLLPLRGPAVPSSRSERPLKEAAERLTRLLLVR